LVGDGPERRHLKRLIRRLGLNNVFLFGFQRQEELPKFYGVSDALVLPSMDEPWGLVVNEAMAAGLPVWVSNRAGCAPDLLEDGGNGCSFNPMDVDSIAAALARFSLLTEEQLLRMGSRSRDLIAGWTAQQTMRGIYGALRTAAPQSWQSTIPEAPAVTGFR